MNALQFAFLGPLVGALSRSLTGWVSDKWGGGRVTFWVFVAHDRSACWACSTSSVSRAARRLLGLLRDVPVLFFATGVGNASTFQMIPAIMRKEMDRLMPDADAADAAAAGGKGTRGDHRLHLGDRGLRRLLHPEEPTARRSP